MSTRQGVLNRVSMLPSLLTVGNFTCGVVAIVFCLQYLKLGTGAMLDYACAAVFIAMVFDMLDGRVARMTGSESHFGAELDSLADDCTFGVVPAVIVTTMWIQAQPDTANWWGQVMFCGIVYAACAILRLARYNVEVGSIDKNYFTGLPSPGAAGAVVSAALFCHRGHLDIAWQWLLDRVSINGTTGIAQMQARVLGVYMLGIGLLMVTRLRFVHIANRFLGGHRGFSYLVAAVLAIFLMLYLPIWMLFLCFNVYVITSLIFNVPRMAISVRRWFSPRVQALRGRRDSSPEDRRDKTVMDNKESG